jgi:hypothetical protein
MGNTDADYVTHVNIMIISVPCLILHGISKSNRVFLSVGKPKKQSVFK